MEQRITRKTAALLAAIACLTTACGGAGLDDAPVSGSATSFRVVPPLLDDEARSNGVDPAARPVQPDIRTRAARYASAAQAAYLHAAVGERALQVDVACCGTAAASAALQAAALVLGERRDVEFVALLVRGAELTETAAVADGLESLAPGRVWLVTP